MNFYKLGFGVFDLKIYGIFVAIAFMISILKFYTVVKKKKLNLNFFIQHFLRWFIAAMLAGRIFVLILHPDIFLANGFYSLFMFWEGEVNFVGASLGFLGASYFDMRAHDEKFFEWMDAAIPSILVGIFFVDIAAFFTGAIYGNETDMFWGVRYETFGVDILNPVHPVTLYAAAFHLGLFLWAKKHQPIYEKLSGKLSLKSAIFFFIIEFFLQFFRGDKTLILLDTIRLEQVFSLIFLIFLFFALKSRKKSS